MKRLYLPHRFLAPKQRLLDDCNVILAEYMARGFAMTVRQLFYQLVVRLLAPNTPEEYERLIRTIGEGRDAGQVDWLAIVDRRRNLVDYNHWDDVADRLKSAAASHRLDRWQGQRRRVEVWVEKEALAGVLDGVCYELGVPLLACVGFNSKSEVWGAAQRLLGYQRRGQDPVILHLADHDPSGWFMTRDIEERLRLYMEPDGGRAEVWRLGLNLDQVRTANGGQGLPSNTAKEKDTRTPLYRAHFGFSQTWELDALDPPTLVALVRDAVEELRDKSMYEAVMKEEDAGREVLDAIADNMAEVEAFVRRSGWLA